MIHFPVTAIVSILHRVTGALLFLTLPFLIYGFNLSVSDRQSYQELTTWMDLWYLKLVVLAWLWALLHHMLAGVRHLLMDLHLGLSRSRARTSAYVAVAGGVIMLIVMFLGW